MEHHARSVDLSLEPLVFKAHLSKARFLVLVDLLNPKKWVLTHTDGIVPYGDFSHVQLSTPIFIDVGFTETGERLYISLNDANTLLSKHSQQMLNMYSEKEVKLLDVKILASRYNYKSYSDFTIIDELCIGANKFVLSNESVLTRKWNFSHRDGSLDTHPVFNNISLIVNCHKTETEARDQYIVKSKKVIYFPIHTLIGILNSEEKKKKLIEIFNEINTEIWNALKTGNVIVHCLAGVHRAGCVTVSHFLWRNYFLNHKHIPNDVGFIYKSLASRREGVAPLSYAELLLVWELHLIC